MTVPPTQKPKRKQFISFPSYLNNWGWDRRQCHFNKEHPLRRRRRRIKNISLKVNQTHVATFLFKKMIIVMVVLRCLCFFFVVVGTKNLATLFFFFFFTYSFHEWCIYIFLIKNVSFWKWWVEMFDVCEPVVTCVFWGFCECLRFGGLCWVSLAFDIWFRGYGYPSFHLFHLSDTKILSLVSLFLVLLNWISSLVT